MCSTHLMIQSGEAFMGVASFVCARPAYVGGQIRTLVIRREESWSPDYSRKVVPG